MTNYEIHKKYAPILYDDYTFAYCYGGRGGGKTTNISLILTTWMKTEKHFCALVVRQTNTSVKTGFWSDVSEIARMSSDFIVTNDKITCIHNGNYLMRWSLKTSDLSQDAKNKGVDSNVNCAVIDEASEITEKEFTKLSDSIRTKKGKKRVILLFNSNISINHWLAKRCFPEKTIKKPNKELYRSIFIHSHYEDVAEHIDEATLGEWRNEAQNRTARYLHDLCGELIDFHDSQIFTNLKPHKQLRNFTRRAYGLDWGYSNDETAWVELLINEKTKEVSVNILAYATKLSNKKLAETVKGKINANAKTAADHDPKSNQEMRDYGYAIVDADKRNKNDKIKQVQQYTIYAPKELHDEAENYLWKDPVNGSGEPKAYMSNGKSANLFDAVRYGLTTKTRTDRFIG